MYIPEIETKSKEEIAIFQEAKLKEAIAYLAANSPYYKRYFIQHGIDPAQITSLASLEKLPCTSKDHLQQYNADFLCVPQSKLIDYLTTSGTLGEPVVFPATEQDLRRLAYNEYISFACAGAAPSDIFQLMVTLDRRFVAGLAYYEGIRKLGAGIVRVGPGNPGLQFDTISRIKPTACVTVPSFLLKLIEYAQANGIDYRSCSIKKAICIGESLRTPDLQWNTLASKIKENWDIELYSTYASTEMGTAFTDCIMGHGGHHHPEMLIVEFLDESGQPVPAGQAGEVTVTTLGVEAMPLLRFRTGDICVHYSQPCPCGRNTIRLGPIIGRTKQMIKYKGTTLYPPALYDLLNDMPGVENYIIEVSTNEIGTDDINIKVGAREQPEELMKKIKDHFRSKLRVAPSIELADPAIIAAMQLPEMSRKPVKFIDKRTNGNNNRKDIHGRI
jgi:phenylacetate-CoA ligase